MSQNKYIVSVGGVESGPFTMDIIVQKFGLLELKGTDFIYDESKNDWVLIAQHPEFIKGIENSKPKSKPKIITNQNTVGTTRTVTLPENPENNVVPLRETEFHPTASSSHSSDDANDDDGILLNDWYILKGKERFGPFAFKDILKMLQEKAVFEYDFIWRQGFEDWKRIAEVAAFTPRKIKELLESKKDKNVIAVFADRKFDRTQYVCTVTAHDNNRVWKGQCLEISEAGAGVLLHNGMLIPGQNIYLHFSKTDGTSPFNVLCEVVSKKFARGLRDRNASIKYNVKFININKQDRDEIRGIISSTAA